MFRNTVSMTFITDCCTQNHFFTMFFHSMDSVLNSGSMFSPLVNICLPKHVSRYTSHILLSISHGFHFWTTKNLMTDLCSRLKHFDLPSFWKASEISLWDKYKFGYKPIQTIHLCKKISEKNVKRFSKKYSLNDHRIFISSFVYSFIVVVFLLLRVNRTKTVPVCSLKMAGQLDDWFK